MYSKFVKLCSIILTLALLINLLPMQVLGEEVQALLAQTENVSSNVVYDNELEVSSDATIIGESVDKRTEFSKEFKLSNGMNMIVVYPEAVHFQKDNTWEEIDNTLVTDNSRSIGTYRNKNNSWNVSLPQQLSASSKVTVEKDGYVVSFEMAGEKRQYAVRAETGVLSMASDNVLAVTEAVQTTSAQVVDLNYEEVKSMSAHPETVADTLQSRLQYSNVYQNTDVQYDLNSYQLKESIILRSYNSAVQGYDYLLETDGLMPVLLEDNSIELQTAKGETIMTLPAPYMIDNNGAISKDVGVTLTPSSKGYLLSYQMPMDWLADANRAWPVVLDPVIEFELYRQNIKDQFVAEYYYEDYNHGALYCGYNKSYGKMRSFLQYVNIPELTSADVIMHAELSLYRLGGSTSLLPIEAHKVLEAWDSQDITWANQPDFNPIIEDYCQVGTTGRYTWEITDIVKEWYKNGNTGSNTGVMLKAPNSVENGTTNFWKKFYSIDYDVTETSICPQMYIYFKNNNGIESYWDYTSASAGRAGTGYINNYSGNLTWIRNDIGFGGNRMPVTISHVYNTNDSAVNSFGMGYGWRTNFNQTASVWPQDSNYYCWEDGDGTKHYFKKESGTTYKDEDGLELTLTVSNGKATITDKNGNKSFFDAQGRLYKMQNNQATKSSITITYANSTSRFITKITDGAGRVYNFTYTNNLLSRISYVGKGTTELSYVTFGYAGSKLTSVVDKDRKFSLYTYSGNYLTSAQDVDDILPSEQDVADYLASVQDVDGYKLTYAYLAGIPKRVGRVGELDGEAEGGHMTIEYAHNQTTFTDHNGNVQILQFNDWGNLIAIQDDQGRAQYVQYARNKHDDDTSKANQMSLSSKMQNTVSNLYSNSSFEDSTMWTASGSSVAVSRSTDAAYLGNYSLKLVGAAEAVHAGAYSQTLSVGAGKTITISAYIKTVDAAAALGIKRQSDGVFFDGEVIAAGKDWDRYQISYTNTSGTTETIRCYIYVKDPGTIYMDCVQAEYASTASRYNLLENGNFNFGTNQWTGTGITTGDTIVSQTPPIAELGANAYSITGSPKVEKSLSQTLNISGSIGDNYVLSGWAKGDSVPLNDTSRKFGLELLFCIGDDVQETFSVSFNADCCSKSSWQYVAVPAATTKDYDRIKVRVSYSNNANTVWFDGIQLFKESFGTSYDYEYDANGNLRVVNVVDLQNQTTEYEYTNNNLTQIIQNNKAQMEYEYDNYHNVIRAVTKKEDANGNIVDGIVYEFEYDAYGNNTLVKVVSGNMSMSSSATYTHAGNHLHTTKDTLANETEYCYNENTSVLEWVQYPNDTPESRTTYTYDDMYRIKTALASVPGLSEGTALTATYDYTGDLLTEIQTGSTTYSFTYGAFSQRTGVSIGSRPLATYAYTNDANRYLEAIIYGNGQGNGYAYDDDGRLIEESLDDGSTVEYTYDNTGALSTVLDSATARTTTYYYDLLDRLGKYKEVGLDGYEHSVAYTYDERNNLAELVENINGVEHVTDYTYDYENRLTETNYGDVSETVQYDAFGRLDGTTIKKDGETVISSWTVYSSGETANTTTTQLTQFGFGSLTDHSVGGQYTYDSNGNIVSYAFRAEYEFNDTPYIEVLTRIGPSYYHYDTANQLVREDNTWLEKTFVWTYDNAGNITSRKEYAYINPESTVTGTPTATYNYTYGDDSWGDLLTAYNGVARTYDEIGNVLTDGTWTYTWQNGRELAAMTDGTTTWSYTYDANGMRTSRTNGTTTYNYVYNGSQLTQMTVGNDTLYFTYGLLGPTTVTWNGTTYYYSLSGQGDVTGIFDEDGNPVVTYNWDNAWGYNPIPEGVMASTLGTLNPLRYRSYVYDEETELYYLQSRYYNPEICRFINADNYPTTGQGLTGNNMFAYCGNNPVIRTDAQGEWWHLIVGAVVGVASQYVSDVVSNLASGKSLTESLIPTSSVVDYLAAGASGALAASGVGALGSAVANAAIDGVAYVANCGINGEEVNGGELLFTVATSALTSGKGVDGANLRGVYKHSKQVLKTAVSPKKIAMYTAKKKKVVTTVVGEIGESLLESVADGFNRDTRRRLNWW
jgi:RHS repeat-associated protein